MGVKYKVCSSCGDPFSECSNWSPCKCGEVYGPCCEDQQEIKYKAVGGELIQCDICSGAVVTPEQRIEELKAVLTECKLFLEVLNDIGGPTEGVTKLVHQANEVLNKEN